MLKNSVALAFIACVYVPVSGAITLSRQIADTYLYGPLMGLGWLVALGASRLAAARPTLERALFLVGLGLLLALLPQRLLTLQNWRDPVTLWSATMARNSMSPQVCRSLGNAYVFNYPGRDPKRVQPQQAIAVYRHCLVSFGRPELYLKNLGIAYLMAGEVGMARQTLGDAQRLKPDDATIRRYLAQLSPPSRAPTPPATPAPPGAP